MLPTQEAKQKRNDLIFADYMDNVPISIIAKKNNLSVARIKQIIPLYTKNKKLADRAHKTLNEEEEGIVRSTKVSRKVSSYMTTISIEGFGTLPFKASPEEIIQTLKDKFSTNLDKLMEMINIGKIDEEKAKTILQFLANFSVTKPPFEEVHVRKQVKPRQPVKTESELANEPDPEDRMKGISFGGL